MELPGEARDSYISVSIAMATFIATQTRDELATCIGYWYAPDEATKDQRNADIIALIAKHDTYHPSSVILALIHDECGRFPSAE